MHVQILNGTKVSVAGWNDPTPAQVLSSMGCDCIILSNQPEKDGEKSGVSVDKKLLLGASPVDAAQMDALFSLDNDESRFMTALQEVDALYCIDWDSPPRLNFECIIADAEVTPARCCLSDIG